MKRQIEICAVAIGLAASTYAATLNLATVSTDTMIADGTIVTGILGSNVKLTIADGATVTLSGATINRSSNGCYWSGLDCEGNATIVLEGANTVYGFRSGYPAIHAAVGHTLTIRGSGSLTARSRGSAAGIGGGHDASAQAALNSGNIVIESGTITAKGDTMGAGIGGGPNGSCGDIIIYGGTITADGGIGGAGIGSGGTSNHCSSVVIYGGNITASGGADAAGIGSGGCGSCGGIVIAGGTVDVTGGNWGAGIGSGDMGICSAVVIKSGIESVTVRKNDDRGELIGVGYSDSTCFGILLDGVFDDETVGRTRTITSRSVNLAALAADTTIGDGKIITGTLGANVKVSIADGATVTLRDVTINGVNNESCKWAGITCLGDATIILEGVNTVTGFFEDYPGIYVPVGGTLAITGRGSLTASQNGWASGIGGGYQNSCGNIRIEGGTVTASGGKYSAGIGGGIRTDCGAITIAESVTCVTAVKGEDAPNSIGSGDEGSVVSVTIGGVVGEIGDSPYTYYGNEVNLSTQPDDYTAKNGEVLYGETEHTVTVPGGATVTINGIEVTGGASAAPTPEFAPGGKSAITGFAKGDGDTWNITAFAELANGASGDLVPESAIKVYRGDTAGGVTNAVTPTAVQKASAVKVDITVEAPHGAEQQFFNVRFGE